MILRSLIGAHRGELRDYPAHIGRNLLANGYVEQPTPKEVDEYSAALDKGAPLPTSEAGRAHMEPPTDAEPKTKAKKGKKE